MIFILVQVLVALLKVSTFLDNFMFFGIRFQIREDWKKKEPLAKDRSKSIMLESEVNRVVDDLWPKSLLKWYLGCWVSLTLYTWTAE